MKQVTAESDPMERKAGAESDAAQHAPSGRPATARPLFFMRGHPVPTVEQIVDLARDLTGREPTPEEIAECRRILDVARPTMQRTPEEQSIIDLVARSRGREWVEAHAESILTQARTVGELPMRSPAEAEAVADQRAAYDAYRKNTRRHARLTEPTSRQQILTAFRRMTEEGGDHNFVVLRADDRKNYYVQFATRCGSAVLYGEAVSNVNLPAPFALTPIKIGALIELGWRPPTRRKFPNFYRWWPVISDRDREAVVDMALATLERVYCWRRDAPLPLRLHLDW